MEGSELQLSFVKALEIVREYFLHFSNCERKTVQMSKWMAMARYNPLVCPLWEGVRERQQAEPSLGVGSGCIQLLPGAGDVGAGLVGALLSQTQPARESICW